MKIYLCFVVTGSIVENYARQNNIEYAPCNQYYEVYTSIRLCRQKFLFYC